MGIIGSDFWKDKNVFITGHTGFKGSWLCLWLHALGADITGYSLEPPTEPSLFELARVDRLTKTIIADIRDGNSLQKALSESKPQIVIHMAAQPLVRESYSDPVETYQVNVMGTVNLLEAVRNTKGVKALINVTTDKCYENKEWLWGYRENEPLGGYDPYSSSKACSELVTSAYRNSFFNPDEYKRHGTAVASARAGNVIGGGDWAADRLVPDCIRAILGGKKIALRNPSAIRPWQHVLEPLSGYLMLARKLFEEGSPYAEAWNFGPDSSDEKSVEWIVRRICLKWGHNASYAAQRRKHLHEAHSLKLDSSKAGAKLGWRPKWDLEKAIEKVIEWTRAYDGKRDVRRVCLKQIKEYSRQ